jgi:hypothetical protein
MSRQSVRKPFSSVFVPVLVVLLSMLSLPALLAQATFGNLIGTVTDPAGAVITGAKVTITSIDRGTVQTTATNDSGNYIQTHLYPGRYKVEVEAAGFQRYVIEETVISIDRSTRVDAQLTVGQVTEQVLVTDAAPALVTDRAEVSVTMSQEQVEDLPLLNRNLTSLQLLLPGAQKSPWQHATSENPQGGIQIHNNGQEFGSTNFTIDGMDNNDPVLGIIVVNPSVESVGEFKQTTGNFDAEFAQAGGAVIQVETKSGTNAIHGSLFEFLQNSSFNARNSFSEPTGPPPLRWNQFGGSLGGPIVKNKFFYFGDVQITRRRTGASLLTTVPTAAVRNGDLSAFDVPIFDPATGTSTGQNRQRFEGNRIPANRISPQARALLDLLPLPNTGGPNAINNNYTTAGSEKFDSEQYNIKADHYVSDNWRYSVRYTLADFDKNSPPAFSIEAGGPALAGLGFAGQSVTRNQNLIVNVNHTITNSLLTDIRFGFNRYKVNVLPLDYGSNTGQAVGIPNVNIEGNEGTSGIPSFEINGNGAFRFGYSLAVNQCNCPLQQREQVYQLVNNWTKISGNHTIKWGADVRRAQNIRIPSDRRRNGQFVFQPANTGSPDVPGSGLGAATFLLGATSSFERFAPRYLDAEDMQWRMFYFIQDRWRVTPKLTLSLGLRWDTWFPNYTRNAGQGSNYDVTTNTVMIAGVGENTKSGNIDTQWKNLSPRISIAYQLNDKTVIRTGFGRSFFEDIFGSSFNYTTFGYPSLITQQVQPTTVYTPVFGLGDGPPPIAFPEIPANGLLPLPNGISQSYRPSDLSFSYVDAWNFSIERLIAENTTATATYVGNVGRNLRQGIPLNQAIPGPGPLNPRRPLFNKFGLTQGITDQSNKGSNSYNALQLKVDRRFSAGFSLLASYTWSKTINNSQGILISNELNRGLADYDRKHVVSVGHTWQLPFGPGRPFLNDAGGLLKQIVGGWDFTGVTQYQSGLPFSPTLANNSSINADIGGLRPDILAGVDPYDVPGGQDRNLWFNPAAYTIPAPFRFGIAGRNSLRGPNLFTADWALHKNFFVGETRSLTLRWEVYNVFNRTNLGLPNGNVDAGAGNAGRITSLFIPMRQMQLGARFEF